MSDPENPSMIESDPAAGSSSTFSEITLRDLFAGLAMCVGLPSVPSSIGREADEVRAFYARGAYLMADALLAARERR